MLFNGSDLKNSNNTIYRFRASSKQGERWYVVRDLGTALGEPARMRPLRNDPDAFERIPFFTGVENGFVVFDFRGWHNELVDGRITAEDVWWASELLARLSDQQWHEAFSAGGYERTVAERFVRRIREKLAEGLSLGVAAD
jgi:hypothetical protein